MEFELDTNLSAALPPDADKSASLLAAIQSFASSVSRWVDKGLPPDHVVDDSRESIYGDRGL